MRHCSTESFTAKAWLFGRRDGVSFGQFLADQASWAVKGPVLHGRMSAKNRSHQHGDGTVLAIAVLKFVKGAVLLALAFGAINLFHKDVASHVEHWLNQLRIDPDNHYIGTLLNRLQLVHTKQLKEFSALGSGYAVLFLTEGTGLLLRKRWAEWLTIVATSSLMPLEFYELVKEFTLLRLLLLMINAAAVVFLIYRVRANPRGRKKTKHSARNQ